MNVKTVFSSQSNRFYQRNYTENIKCNNIRLFKQMKQDTLMYDFFVVVKSL